MKVVAVAVPVAKGWPPIPNYLIYGDEGESEDSLAIGGELTKIEKSFRMNKSISVTPMNLLTIAFASSL